MPDAVKLHKATKVLKNIQKKKAKREILLDEKFAPLSYGLCRDEPEYVFSKQELNDYDRKHYRQTYVQYRKNPYF